MSNDQSIENHDRLWAHAYLSNSDSDINKASHNMLISRGILKWCPISRAKVQVKINMCSSRLIISNAKTGNKILFVFRMRKYPLANATPQF